MSPPQEPWKVVRTEVPQDHDSLKYQLDDDDWHKVVAWGNLDIQSFRIHNTGSVGVEYAYIKDDPNAQRLYARDSVTVEANPVERELWMKRLTGARATGQLTWWFWVGDKHD